MQKSKHGTYNSEDSQGRTRDQINIKKPSYRYRDSQYKDEMVIIFVMGIPILVRDLYIESSPRSMECSIHALFTMRLQSNTLQQVNTGDGFSIKTVFPSVRIHVRKVKSRYSVYIWIVTADASVFRTKLKKLSVLIRILRNSNIDL